MVQSLATKKLLGLAIGSLALYFLIKPKKAAAPTVPLTSGYNPNPETIAQPEVPTAPTTKAPEGMPPSGMFQAGDYGYRGPSNSVPQFANDVVDKIFTGDIFYSQPPVGNMQTSDQQFWDTYTPPDTWWNRQLDTTPVQTYQPVNIPTPSAYQGQVIEGPSQALLNYGQPVYTTGNESLLNASSGYLTPSSNWDAQSLSDYGTQDWYSSTAARTAIDAFMNNDSNVGSASNYDFWMDENGNYMYAGWNTETGTEEIKGDTAEQN